MVPHVASQSSSLEHEENKKAIANKKRGNRVFILVVDFYIPMIKRFFLITNHPLDQPVVPPSHCLPHSKLHQTTTLFGQIASALRRHSF